MNDMTAAIEQVLKDKPDLFNYGDTAAGTGWPAVKNLAAYHGAVVEVLVHEGLLREGRRRGDRGQAGLEHAERAVRHQLPGQVHPAGPGYLSRELLSGGLLAGREQLA